MPDQHEKTRKMVVDAVAVEPVSASKFPANREKNRECFDFRTRLGRVVAKRSAKPCSCTQIPYGAEQGNNFIEQGSAPRRTANCQRAEYFPSRKSGFIRQPSRRSKDGCADRHCVRRLPRSLLDAFTQVLAKLPRSSTPRPASRAWRPASAEKPKNTYT